MSSLTDAIAIFVSAIVIGGVLILIAGFFLQFVNSWNWLYFLRDVHHWLYCLYKLDTTKTVHVIESCKLDPCYVMFNINCTPHNYMTLTYHVYKSEFYQDRNLMIELLIAYDPQPNDTITIWGSPSKPCRFMINDTVVLWRRLSFLDYKNYMDSKWMGK